MNAAWRVQRAGWLQPGWRWAAVAAAAVLRAARATALATALATPLGAALTTPAQAGELRPDAEVAAIGQLLPLAYHYDASGRKTEAEILALSNAAWRPLGSDGANFGFTTGVFWFRGQVRAAASQDTAHVLEISNPHLNHVAVTLKAGPSPQQLRDAGHWAMGNALEFEARPIVSRNFAVPVQLQPGEMLSVLVRAESRGAMQMPIQLWPDKEFQRRIQARLRFDSIYAGLLSGIVVANLALFLAWRRRVFLVHAAWEIAMCTYLMTLNGSAFPALWPQHPALNQYVLPIAAATAAMMATLFTLAFVQNEAAPQWQRMVRRAMVGLNLATAVAAFALSYRLAIQMAVALVMVSVVVSTVHCLQGLLERNAAAKYTLVGFGAMYAAGGVQALSKFGVLPSTPWTNFDMVQVCSVVEVLVMICGLTLHIERSRLASLAPGARRSPEGAAPGHADAGPDPGAVHTTDPLCGVMDGPALRSTLDAEIARAVSLSRPLAVALVSLDHFRQFNEANGQPAGDRCLQRVAQEIKRQLPREGDVVARLGGKEFAMVLPNAHVQGAMLVCERIRAAIAALPPEEGRHGGGATVSIGLACQVPEAGDDHSRLLSRARDALGRAKREGRNRTCRAA